ncbi:MAG: GlsB/YeaQ/YmgE family stress response membrane protein [Acidimicrobiales bacterium]|jgi:uncharacterized membrane protein YeaQ/YmgE (transglycosylase-associated protein family)|nr:GlsB/YeaQ/YmgE family stress response membrane protein [Acidimicrobiales bacterium]
MDWISTIIGALLAGVIIGPLARLLMPGKQNVGIVLTIVVGAVGALVGDLVARALGVGDTSGIDWIRHGLQILFAILALAGLGAIRGRSSTPTA